MLPQMIPTVLGAAGGLIGGLLGAATKVPESLMQAGTQAVGAATQGLSGLAQPKTDPLEAAVPGMDPGAGTSGTWAAAVVVRHPRSQPVVGRGTVVERRPLGRRTADPSGHPGRGRPGRQPRPSGGMGGMPMVACRWVAWVALAARPAAVKAGRMRPGAIARSCTRDIPHTEDVTGRVDPIGWPASAASRATRTRIHLTTTPRHRTRQGPVVRRLTTRPPKEPT